MEEFDCLIGFVGLSADNGVVESGLYVDTLPDISQAHISKLIDGEDNVLTLWHEIEKRAVLKFRTFFIREINHAHKISDRQKCECLICENKYLLATALWYLLGEEVMNARVASSRLNTYTTIDKSRSKELRETFHESFLQELETAVAGIDVHASVCFSCNDQPQINDIITFREPII